MSDPLTSERDSLLQAIALAQKEVTQAQEAQKAAEGKIPALQARMDKQHTKFVFMQSRLEKEGLGLPWEEDQDGRIKLLESQYEEMLAENVRLRELLQESVKEDDSQAESGSMSMSAPITPSEPAPLGDNSSVEIKASPKHQKRSAR